MKSPLRDVLRFVAFSFLTLLAMAGVIPSAEAADTQAPTVPTNLAASPVSSTQVNLSWSASSDNVAVTAYLLERCTGASCTNFAQIASTASISYSNTGLASATTYNYRLRARDAANNRSAYSAIVAVSTPADTQPPTAPSGLTATAVSSTEIDLSWAAATDNVKVTGYLIERCTGASCTNFAQIATITATSYSNKSLVSTSYSYRVRAKDAAGNLSNYSTIASATTQTPADTQAPTAPTGFTATAASSTQISLSWTASTDNVAVTGYLVERCSGASCTTFAQIAAPTTTTYSDTGLSASTGYSYRVRASDAAGNLSGYSNVVTTTTPAPTAPTGLSATATSTNQINLSWSASTDNAGVTNYLIERCSGSGCPGFVQVATSTATTLNDTGLSPSTSYSYRVRASDAATNLSAYSTAASATTLSAITTVTYTYDNLKRVIQATGSDGTSVSYSYDANGNVSSITRTGP